MLDLENVTLCCVDTVNPALALRALERSCRDLRYARALLLTNALPPHLPVPAAVEVLAIEPLRSRVAYSTFVLKQLLPYVATSHVLVMQWDGYVIHPQAWDAAFLDYDYIGAVWIWHNDGMRVGNGGFSLRSRRLLEALQDPRIQPDAAEDETICRSARPLLENEYGIRFADEATANRFAFEAAQPGWPTFGFHGLYNFCRVMPAAELAALVPSFSDAIARSPQFAQLLRNCRALGQWAAAIAIGERILAVQPDNADLSVVLQQLKAQAAQVPIAGRNEACPCGSGKRYKHCHGAVALAPAAANETLSADALLARAMEAHQRGAIDTAERDYRSLLAAVPEHPVALHYLGVIHYQRNELAQALPLLEQAVAAMPQEPEFHNNLGLALAAADRNTEAIDAYRRALALRPDHAGAWSNLGLVLQAANDLDGAIDAFRSALHCAPDFAEAHWNLGLALLAKGDFAAGWREYDWRLEIPQLGKHGRPYPGLRWDGSDSAGKTLLLTREQGLGDTLQFARFAQSLAALGLQVAMEVPEALVSLITRVPGVSGVYGPADPLPAADLHLPLLSVAGVLGMTESSIPNRVPYIEADTNRAAALSPHFDRDMNSLNIGLAWAGRRDHRNDRRRSCPLAMLAPLLELPGCAWFSLQKDDGEEQIPSVPAARKLILLDARKDFEGKAALVSRLDLVISVDTSSAHLAGALGRPVWILLPHAADWRWQQSRNDSPWYPTARLFRQPRLGDWPAVASDVRVALQPLLAAGRC